MSKKVIIVIVCVGIVLVLTTMMFLGSKSREWSEQSPPFITANPLDLTQVQAISQFRSCEGHNYSGRNAEGVEETHRTMKHYIAPIAALENTEQQFKVFAPFDGRVSDIPPDTRGSYVYLSPDTDHGGWDFIFFHVDVLPHIREGARVNAGDLIGYADLVQAANFDFALRSFGFGPQRNDSPFTYMTPKVLAEYKAAGITQENIIIPKEVRDSRPCELAPGQSGRDAFYAQSEAGKSWIRLVN